MDVKSIVNLVLIIILSIILLILLVIIILGIVGYNLIYKKTKKPYSVLDVPDSKFRFPLIVKDYYKEYKNIPCEDVYVINKRNKKLHAELRKSKNQENNNKPTVILFSHGHLSSGDNDVPLFGNFQLKKYDLFAIDHESNGKSEGRHSGFGIYEYENIILWVDKINQLYNHNVNIFLHGVSLGSNSVLLTANKKMENVKGIIGDCGFTSTYDIVKYLSKLNFVAFSVCFINSFIIRRNIFKYSTTKTLSKSMYPLLLIHGKEDNFVPFFMSVKNNSICSSKHKFIQVDKANHAMSYLTNPKLYEEEFDNFIKENVN